MSVVFLIHHPVNGLKWLQAYSAILECDITNALAVRRMGRESFRGDESAIGAPESLPYVRGFAPTRGEDIRGNLYGKSQENAEEPRQ